MHSQNTHRTRFQQIEETFNRVLEYSPAERKSHLHRLCGDDITLRSEVESLLYASEQADGFLSIAPEVVEQVFAEPLDPDSLLNQRFGPYRLLRVLERGGMGVVFLAERADGHYDQSVAIKFARYRIGVSSLMGRFQKERQILANIRHPNVARLLDGGTSADGYPYLVMEYIRGQAIDHYCQLHKLTPRQILELFLIVCETVQHAQQNLIVHCDLKPDNIMVTADGNPKLLDFGIAQLLDPLRNQTGVANSIGSLNPLTPEFAAPEQLQGERITTATDVYALGNILYRLLTGVTPQLATAPVDAPSSVAPEHLRKPLRCEIDAIVIKALSHNPNERYSSAQQLADDLRRFLSGHIVTASNTGALYRSGKFLNRHRLGVALALFSVVSILVGIVATTLQWRTAEAEREIAKQRLSDVRELANTIVFDLPTTISALPGSTLLRERLLNQGIAYLDRLSQGQPDAGLRQDLAGAYHELATLQGNPMKANLGHPESALRNYAKSIAIRKALLSDDPANERIITGLATSYALMSGIHGGTFNDTDTARTLTDRCLELLAPFANAGIPAVTTRLLSCQTIGAHWANVDADYTAAAAYLEPTERLLKRLPESDDSRNASEVLRLGGRVHEEWAQIFASTGKLSNAVMHERKRLTLWSRTSDIDGMRSRLMGAAHHGLAARLAAAGHTADALDAYQRALTHWNTWRARYPADISAIQAMAIVHAEVADLHWRHQGLREEPSSRTRELACHHYKNSIDVLDESTAGSRALPLRYPWSPTAVQIRAQYSERCEGTV